MRLKNYYNINDKYSVIDIIEDYQMSFSMGNAFKYLHRCNTVCPKGEIDNDLIKALSYLNREKTRWHLPAMPPSIPIHEIISPDKYNSHILKAIVSLLEIYWLDFDDVDSYERVSELFNESINNIEIYVKGHQVSGL